MTITNRTFSLAALCVAGFALAGVTMALIAPTLPPREGVVMWPLLVVAAAITATLFVGRQYVLPKPLADRPTTSLLAIVGLVVGSQALAFGLSRLLNAAVSIPMPLLPVIWFALLWSGVNYLHRGRFAS